MSSLLLRSVLDLRPAVASPIRSSARLFVVQSQAPIARSVIAAPAGPVRHFSQTRQRQQQQQADRLVQTNSSTISISATPQASTPNSSQQQATVPKPLSQSVRTLLPLLAAQPGHYITIHIHGRPYLVTEGDSVRLPFKMPGVAPGDVLRLTRASVLGSRDFTLRGAPFVDERLFECRAVVTGTESEPLRIKIKKKPRCRRTKHVKSKHRYTMLRISELRIRTEALEESS